MSRVFRQVMTGLVSIVRRTSELLLTASREGKRLCGEVRGGAGRCGRSSRSASAERLRFALCDEPRSVERTRLHVYTVSRFNIRTRTCYYSNGLDS